MKVSIQTLGTYGDVMPYISLSLALKKHGHSVSLFAPRDYFSLIEDYGIEASRPTRFSIHEWMATAEQRGTLSGPIGFIRDWRSMIKPQIAETYKRCLDAAEGADLVLGNLICAPARVAAENLGKAYVVSALQPVLSPTREVPCVTLLKKDAGPFINRISYASVNLALAALGINLRKFRKPGMPALSSFSKHLDRPLYRLTSMTPVLLGKQPSDWDQHSHLTPYWSLPDTTQWNPTGKLAEFLANGDKPVYVGLGSMQLKNPQAFMRTVLDGLQRAGCRAILSGNLFERLSDKHPDNTGSTICVSRVPHDQLFKACAAVVHHGGAGTTDTALRANRSQIVLPYMLDQHWTAWRLHRLGLIPEPVRADRLTAEDFPRMLHEVRGEEMAANTANAHHLSMQADGIGKSVALIERAAAEFYSD
ncbi:MAG: glycosyltransferase [Granulosicoccus sp.]